MKSLLAGAIVALHGSLSFAAAGESALAGYWSGSARRDGIEHAIAVRLVVQDDKLIGTWTGLRCQPSLWIWGDADTIIPLRESVAGVRKSRAHPMPELLVLPKAGHSFTVSTTAIPQLAEGYPDAVIRWINGLSR